MQEASDTLKQAPITASVLAYSDFAKPFIVANGASKRAIHAVFSQKDENRQECPVHYAIRGLNDADKNYSTYEREVLRMVLALVLVFALKNFRHYLLWQNFN